MEITNYRKVDRGGLIGTFTLTLSNGIELRELKLCRSGNGEFIGFPSRKYQDREGNDKYANFIAIPDNATYQRFTAKCLELLQPYRSGQQEESQPEAQKQDDIPF